jgi:hypothetical protein
MMRRTCAAIAIAGPFVAAATVLIAEASTPQYSAITYTVSRLAAPGMPRAGAIEFAILITALACFALGAVDPQSRRPLAVAGAALLLAAIFRYAPSSTAMTLVHRMWTAVALAAFVVAPLIHGRFSRAVAGAEIALLVAAPLLLATQFDAWGLWERCLLAIPLGWMTVVAVHSLRAERTIVSSDEMISAAAASFSSTGS